MEKNTVTIEIKQEVSVTLLWIVGGVILVCLAFFLTPRSNEIWPALNSAGVAGGVYFIVMLVYALRKPIGWKTKIGVGAAALIVLSVGAFTWSRQQSEVEWHAENILRVRGVIGRGVMEGHMSTVLLKTLDEFYQSGSAKKKSLAEVFGDQHAGVVVGFNIHMPEWEGDWWPVIVARLEPDEIELVSQETYVTGRNPQFRNYNGQVGMIQERVVLTEKGVSHVSDN